MSNSQNGKKSYQIGNDWERKNKYMENSQKNCYSEFGIIFSYSNKQTNTNQTKQ